MGHGSASALNHCQEVSLGSALLGYPSSARLGYPGYLGWLALLAGLLARGFSYETIVKNMAHEISGIRRASGGVAVRDLP